jgi:lipocalin-like protein
MVRALFVLFGLLISLQCFAQQSILGTYKLVANDIRLDGQPLETMKSPHGYLIITPKVAIVFFTSAERKRGDSPEAKAALLDSMAAWAGPYRLEGDKIVVSVENAWTEVWKGTQQSRSLEIKGKRLALVSEPIPSTTQPGKTLVSRTEWEKID